MSGYRKDYGVNNREAYEDKCINNSIHIWSHSKNLAIMRDKYICALCGSSHITDINLPKTRKTIE